MRKPTSGLRLRRLDDNVAFAPNEAVAWYRLDPVRTAFRVRAEIEALITDHALAYANLVGRRLHLRVTTAPDRPAVWASGLAAASPGALPGFTGVVEADAAWLARLELSAKRAYLGVSLSGRVPLRRLGPYGETKLMDRLAPELNQLDGQLATLGALRLDVNELEWLARRSVCLGHPSPEPGSIGGPWSDDDLAVLAESATWSAEPYGRSVRIVADIAGDQIVRHVVVLSVGRMAEQHVPPEPGWLARADHWPFPVEISGHVRVLSDQRVNKTLRDALSRIGHQANHYREHQEPPPRSLELAQARALEVESELAAGLSGLATRTEGWYRLAVSGETEEEALSRARKVADFCAPSVTLVRQADQLHLAREFIPGSTLANTASRRRFAVVMLAGALPSSSPQVGHETGAYLGVTTGTGEHRPVVWDHWHGPDNNRSGLTLVSGEPGSGKSSLLGLLAYWATLRGGTTVAFDPSGPLAEICSLPELAGHAAHVDLLHGKPGILNPYRLVADPAAEGDSDLHRLELDNAAQQRRDLLVEAFLGMLPHSVALDPKTLAVVQDGARRVEATQATSPREVLAALEAMADPGPTVAGFLTSRATSAMGRLVFPTGNARLDHQGDDRLRRLTVITLAGLDMPRDDLSPEDYSTEERVSLVLLTLSAWLARRMIYGAPTARRKALIVDECHQLTQVAAGRLVLSTAARDSRKRRLATYFASQDPADFLSLPAVGSVTASAFVGRLDDAGAQEAALRLLRLPAEERWAKAIAALSLRSGVRNFLVRDDLGRLDRVAIDLRGRPELAAALDTTPTEREAVA